MYFLAMYRLFWYRRAFTRYGASNKCRVGKTSYFWAKFVNITRQMALTAAALLKQVVNLSATCFHIELEQFSACFCVARVCQRQLGFLVNLCFVLYFPAWTQREWPCI